MARDVESAGESIVDIDVSDEMRSSFLEYAYSVIYARALPDARDGLKPVQRRIIYQMSVMGLRPDRGHVKSSRVVGDVMAHLHPHGDAAIYDALVRLAQPFAMRVPLVDGHGNFGSLDDGPAAPRYTEARMAAAALDMVESLDEDVVDFVPNYDNQTTQPEVLPAAFPNLLVNGASGIAVGMATNIPPHNLGEVSRAAMYLLDNPDATIDDLMLRVPGPDFPSGGVIVDRTGIEEAYRSGRGIFRTRAAVSIERVSARKRGIVVTELPYMVGPERVIEKLKEAVTKGRVQGVSAVTNLTDRTNELRLVIEVKNGFNPEAVLAQLYKHTPLEDSFGINAVALVDGQPRTMNLKEILEVFLDHRLSIVLRRSHSRLTRALERLHLVEGLLTAIVDIDRVIRLIRAAESVGEARQGLMDEFGLDVAQADHILELRLRRLTKFSRIELEAERDDLSTTVEQLRVLVSDATARRTVVRNELEEVAGRLGTPRRTRLLDSTGPLPDSDVPLEISDDPCRVVLSARGQLVRISGAEPASREGPRQVDDAIRADLATTARSTCGVVLDTGEVARLDVVDIPQVPRTECAPSLSGGVPALQLVNLEDPSQVVGLISLADDAAPVWAMTERGVVKRVRAEHPTNKDRWTMMALDSNDRIVACGHAGDDATIVSIASSGQLLRMSADKVRPQGLSASGMAGMKLIGEARVIAANAIAAEKLTGAYVVTVAGCDQALPGTGQTSVKVTPLELYPIKGRSGQGVRAHRLLRGEDGLVLAAITPGVTRAIAEDGAPLDLPAPDERRDGSGEKLHHQIFALG